MTTRHTVSGVASSRPSGPHAHVQNATAMSRPTSETPALRAYSSTSSTPLVNTSSTAKSPTTSSPFVQPSNTAIVIATGSPAPSQMPTYGRKRSAPASTPNRIAYGTPIRNSPAATSTANVVLTSDCVSR